MAAEQNKEVARQLFDAHARFDASGVKEILSPKLVWHHAGEGQPLTRDDYLKGLEMGRQAFSDVALRIDDMIAEGDRVAVRLTHTMRHSGTFLDIPPTGRMVTFSSIWIHKIAERRVVEIWHIDENFVPLLRGVGSADPSRVV